MPGWHISERATEHFTLTRGDIMVKPLNMVGWLVEPLFDWFGSLVLLCVWFVC